MIVEVHNKITPGFSPFALASVVLLLFMLMMLTSSVTTPSGLKIDVPLASGGRVAVQKLAVTITRDLHYLVNDRKVSKGTLAGELKRRIGSEKGAVVIYVDRGVSAQQLIEVSDLIRSLEAEVVVATKPD